MVGEKGISQIDMTECHFCKNFKKHTTKLHVFLDKDQEKRTIAISELIIVVISLRKRDMCWRMECQKGT